MLAGIVPRSALVLLALAFWGGCSSSPESSRDTPAPAVHRSRDGRLQYVTPPGWFDATADSQAAGHVVWIIRNDYGGTLTLDEVRFDAAARAAVRDGGLEPLAQLLMTLPSGDRSVSRLSGPETFEREGTMFCRYEVEVYETRDLVRVVLFHVEDRVYSCTLVVPAAIRDRGSEQLVEEQAAFLGAVAWGSL
jgi:hypothetical protein